MRRLRLRAVVAVRALVNVAVVTCMGIVTSGKSSGTFPEAKMQRQRTIRANCGCREQRCRRMHLDAWYTLCWADPTGMWGGRRLGHIGCVTCSYAFSLSVWLPF